MFKCTYVYIHIGYNIALNNEKKTTCCGSVGKYVHMNIWYDGNQLLRFVKVLVETRVAKAC